MELTNTYVCGTPHSFGPGYLQREMPVVALHGCLVTLPSASVSSQGQELSAWLLGVPIAWYKEEC